MIVPVYNVGTYIGSCLESIKAQSYKGSLECLIIDDCGTDDSMAIVNQFLSSYKGSIDFRIISQGTNKGLAAARNSGLDNAIGDYVLFLDSDDEVTPDSIEVLTKPIADHDYDMVIGDFIISGSYRFKEVLKLPDGPINGNSAVMDTKTKNMWYQMAVNKLYNKSFLNKNGLRFKEGIIHEDELWSDEIACLANDIYVVKQPTYLYKIREGSITTASNVMERVRSLNIIVHEFYCFMERWGLRSSFRANNLLQSLFSMPTWEVFRNNPDGFKKEYYDLRAIVVKPPKSYLRINGFHIRQQVRDLHLMMPKKIGSRCYYTYCTINERYYTLKQSSKKR